MTVKFSELEWLLKAPGVWQSIVELPNGYDASILKGEGVSPFVAPGEYELMEYAPGGWPPLENTMRRGGAEDMQAALDEIAARPPVVIPPGRDAESPSPP